MITVATGLAWVGYVGLFACAMDYIKDRRYAPWLFGALLVTGAVARGFMSD